MKKISSFKNDCIYIAILAYNFLYAVLFIYLRCTISLTSTQKIWS